MTLKSLLCKSCGKESVKFSAMQLYCRPCSADADMKRKNTWAKEHPRPNDPDRNRRNNIRRREAIEYLRNTIGLEYKSLADADTKPIFKKMVKIAVPFTSALLKNHSWSLSRHGHVFLRKETVAAQNALQLAMARHKDGWKNHKVWLSIFVQKPNHRSGDAVNMVDRICDAIKVSIGVDDRWFCLKSVDWEICKNNPRIFISIGQEDCEHSQVCSICGQILTLDKFQGNKSRDTGVGRECYPCLDRLKALIKEMSSNQVVISEPNVL